MNDMTDDEVFYEVGFGETDVASFKMPSGREVEILLDGFGAEPQLILPLAEKLDWDEIRSIVEAARIHGSRLASQRYAIYIGAQKFPVPMESVESLKAHIAVLRPHTDIPEAAKALKRLEGELEHHEMQAFVRALPSGKRKTLGISLHQLNARDPDVVERCRIFMAEYAETNLRK